MCFVCVCVFYAILSYVNVYDHHHTQDTEQFHHYQDPSCYTFMRILPHQLPHHLTLMRRDFDSFEKLEGQKL